MLSKINGTLFLVCLCKLYHILYQLCVLWDQALLPYLLQNFSKEAAMGSVSINSTGRTRCEMFADTKDSHSQ